MKREINKKREGYIETILSENTKNPIDLFPNLNYNKSNAIGKNTSPFRLKDEKAEKETSEKGLEVKKRVQSAFSRLHPESKNKDLFKDIDEEAIEKNIPLAESVIERNLALNPVNKSTFEKLPYLKYGLATAYAAAETGNHTAANAARNLAYTEDDGLGLTDGNVQPSETQTSNKRYVNADLGLNLRSEPGTDKQIIGKLSKGDEVEFTGNKTGKIGDHEWAEIRYGDKTGWVAEEFLNTERRKNTSNNLVKTPENSPYYQKTLEILKEKKIGSRYVGEDGLRLYTDATIKSENVDIVSLGEEVIYLGEKKKVDDTEWAKVSYNGKIGWVKADYLKTDKNAAKGNAYEYLSKELTETDINAGLKIAQKDGKYYYDYTDVIMNRMNEVMPDFYAQKVLSYEDYVDKFTLKLNGKYPIGSEPTVADYYENVLGKLSFFFFQVNHGAPWDIKRDDPWKMQFGDIKMPYYDGTDDKNEKFLFRGELITREDLGNITYGYLGSAMGLGELTLFWGAGVANNWYEAIIKGKAYNPEDNYGDRNEDHKKVKKGIQMYYEDNPNAKPGINRTFP